MKKSKEIWRDIEGFEGSYKISNYGQVKSLSRYILFKTGYIKDHKGGMLKFNVNKDGYCRICLRGIKGDTHLFIHRLVANAFILNPENKPFVNHKDFNPSNNEVSNLEWVTHQENILHARNNRPWRKLDINKAKQIRHLLNEGAERKSIQKWYGVKEMTISDIFNNKTWRTETYNHIQDGEN